ncbi:MAG TPA: hypothetical protein VGM54_08445 [Chthoniobacter sp.]|jgi:hypothetical protein
MTASHRTPATVLMFVGGMLFVAAVMLPIIIAPGTPPEIHTVANILRIAAAIPFMLGACIYAKGAGYPFWLGIFSLTIVGFLILLWLPDRHPEPDDVDT